MTDNQTKAGSLEGGNFSADNTLTICPLLEAAFNYGIREGSSVFTKSEPTCSLPLVLAKGVEVGREERVWKKL